MIINDFEHLEENAKEFATRLHSDPRYNLKHGEIPYVDHLDNVRRVLSTFGYNGIYGVAAWLHDLIEDSNVDVRLLQTLFGAKPATLVWAVSGVVGKRKDHDESIYDKLELIPDAIPLKLAGRIVNVEWAKSTKPEFFEMYRREHDTFTARVKPLRIEVAMWERLDKAFGR
jgi:guanosine-3',5'-bis(diphosphate) 3'-pyrophosphohydrolase